MMEANLLEIDNELMKQNKQLQALLSDALLRLELAEAEIRLLKNKLFGTKSEKFEPEQPNLFNEVEELCDEAVTEPTYEEVTYKRRKEKRSKEELLKDLPIETIEYTLDEPDRLCPYGHGPLRVIGKEVTREVVVKPAQYFVREHVVYKYACKPCEVAGNPDNKTPILAAPKPKRALPGSMASSSLVAYVIDQKYTYGMSLYRQEQQFERNGLQISRQTLANWVIKAANLCEPLYDHMHNRFQTVAVAMADETPVQVLREPGRSATTKSFMWVYRTGRFEATPMVLYNYRETRSGQHAKDFLADFKGYLHVDGYTGYNAVDGITRVGCLVHARRKFDEALNSYPKKGAERARTLTNKALNYFKDIYKIERKIRDLSIDKRLDSRLEKSKPLLDEFFAWLNEQSVKVLSQSKLGKAISYTLNQWPYLINYLLDGRLEPDNNRTERSIKPFVVGRKGWLFSNTPKGATASSIIYSLVETAKENNLKPYNYMEYLFDTIPNLDLTQPGTIDCLLPWSASIPESCRS